MNKRLLSLLLAALMLLALAACKSEEAPAATTEAPVPTTFPDVPGVMLVPDDFWDETEPAKEETVSEETEAAEQTELTEPTEEQPAETVPETSVPAEPAETVAKTTEYEWFHALSGEEQEAYMDSFDSIAAFFEWYNAAKAEYEELHPSIEVGDGNIDLGQIIGGKG